MRRRNDSPHYSLDQAKALIESGDVQFWTGARRYITNHYDYFDFDEIAKGVFASMGDEHFYKSDELRKQPGTYADIYSGMSYDGTEWYVKFYIDEAEDKKTLLLSVCTMCWDGAVH